MCTSPSTGWILELREAEELPEATSHAQSPDSASRTQVEAELPGNTQNRYPGRRTGVGTRPASFVCLGFFFFLRQGLVM
jgi:hypothetical protein